MIAIPEKAKRNKKKLAIMAVALILIGGGVAYKFGGGNDLAGASPAAGGPPGGGMPPTKVEATKAVRESISSEIKLVGSLTSNESVTISSEISGRIIDIPFKEGAPVNKGDVLFRLDSSVQKAALAQAEANFSLAENNNKRYSGLIETGAISKVQAEQAAADLSLATANIEFAKANLAKTTIRAPFSGVAGIRKVSIGDVVTNGQELVNLEQMNPMRVLFTVPEKYLNGLKTKQTLQMNTEAAPEPFTAEVFAIDPRIDPSTRSVSVQASANNEDGKLYPGQFVTISLPLGESSDSVVIPDQALVPVGETTKVYTVVDGKAKANQVEVGKRVNSKAEILKGINEGDLVIVAGTQKIGPDAPVRVAEPTEVTVKPAEIEDEKTLKE